MGREPRHGANVADELRALLSALHLPGPYFLVAHSAGCLYARIFVSRFSRSVGGVLLIEPGDKPFLDAFGTKHLSGLEHRRWEDLWERTWSRLAQGGDAYGMEVRAKEETLGQIQGSLFPPEVPLTVVSAVDTSRPGWFLSELSPGSIEKFYRQKIVFHEDLARASLEGQQVTAHGAPHAVHEEHPELVIRLILEGMAGRGGVVVSPDPSDTELPSHAFGLVLRRGMGECRGPAVDNRTASSTHRRAGG
jgi:pimeloyl-ACP methyl ester carboxylesterase